MISKGTKLGQIKMMRCAVMLTCMLVGSLYDPSFATKACASIQLFISSMSRV